MGTFALSRPSPYGGAEPNLAEIEAQLMRTAGSQPRMMSLEEVEASLMRVNDPILSESMIAEQEAKRARLEQRRAERQAKQAELVMWTTRLLSSIPFVLSK